MNKYSGMNHVKSKVRVSGEVVRKNKRKGGFLKTFGVQAAVAAAIFGALWCARSFGGKAEDFAQKVKDAVCFDTFGYAISLIDDGESNS